MTHNESEENPKPQTKKKSGWSANERIMGSRKMKNTHNQNLKTTRIKIAQVPK